MATREDLLPQPRANPNGKALTGLQSLIQVIHAAVFAFGLVTLASMINGVAAARGADLSDKPLPIGDFALRFTCWLTFIVFLMQDIGAATRAGTAYPYKHPSRYFVEILIAAAQVATLALIGSGRFAFVWAFAFALLINSWWWWLLDREYGSGADSQTDGISRARFTMWIEFGGMSLFALFYGGALIYTRGAPHNGELTFERCAAFLGLYITWAFVYEILLRAKFPGDDGIGVTLIPPFRVGTGEDDSPPSESTAEDESESAPPTHGGGPVPPQANNPTAPADGTDPPDSDENRST